MVAGGNNMPEAEEYLRYDSVAMAAARLLPCPRTAPPALG